jgi:NAD(P)-dependent dehydrogenase (short-subunit alcohol dehydrogenase family)
LINSDMPRRLEGKIAVITGGGGGIGSTTARLFCREGAKVAIIDRESSILDPVVESIKQDVQGAEIIRFPADLGMESEAQRVIDMITATFDGRLAVLVNNVAIRNYDPLAQTTWSTWEPIVQINILSFVSMVRAALPLLRKRGKASVINVSSVNAVYGRKGMGAYDAMKAAVLPFTRTLAFEETEHGIRANSVCPGYTRTVFHTNRLGEDSVDAIVPPCVMRRCAEPEDLAYPMLWLASDEASYVTAATLMVDGGFPL